MEDRRSLLTLCFYFYNKDGCTSNVLRYTFDVDICYLYKIKKGLIFDMLTIDLLTQSDCYVTTITRGTRKQNKTTKQKRKFYFLRP